RWISGLPVRARFRAVSDPAQLTQLIGAIARALQPTFRSRAQPRAVATAECSGRMGRGARAKAARCVAARYAELGRTPIFASEEANFLEDIARLGDTWGGLPPRHELAGV